MISIRNQGSNARLCHDWAISEDVRELPTPLYERVGGDAYFEQLTSHFYASVATDPVLLRLYPDQVDLEPARQRLCLFLIQYWGGPMTYMEQRGHPRLRMRHVPFVIGAAERDAWVNAMSAAVDATGVGEPERGELLAYFEMAATHLQNQPQ